MSAVRAVAVIIGLAAIALVSAALVRALAIASGAVDWPLPRWWTEPGHPATTPAAIVAVVLVGSTAALVFLAVRQLRGPRRGLDYVEFAAEAGHERLAVPALEAALGRHLERELPGVSAAVVRLVRAADGWDARLEVDVAARDLAGVRVGAAVLLAGDLRSTGEMRLAALDVVVRRLSRPVGAG